MKKILIIGAGKVGTATGIALDQKVDYHDPFKGIVNDEFTKYDYIIVCVDTVQSGPHDYRDLENALDNISRVGYSGTVVIRSTISPKKIYEWNKDYDFKYILFPEFMSQRDGALVTDKTWIVVLGGSPSETKSFANDVLIKMGYPAKPEAYVFVSKDEAAIIKLADNAALSTKLTYFNSIYKICQDYGASYETVRSAIAMDDRIGGGHSSVPSPDDGQLGFGGHCLPKDLLAIAEIDTLELFTKISEINNRLRSK